MDLNDFAIQIHVHLALLRLELASIVF